SLTPFGVVRFEKRNAIGERRHGILKRADVAVMGADRRTREVGGCLLATRGSSPLPLAPLAFRLGRCSLLRNRDAHDQRRAFVLRVVERGFYVAKPSRMARASGVRDVSVQLGQ